MASLDFHRDAPFGDVSRLTGLTLVKRSVTGRVRMAHIWRARDARARVSVLGESYPLGFTPLRAFLPMNRMAFQDRPPADLTGVPIGRPDDLGRWFRTDGL